MPPLASSPHVHRKCILTILVHVRMNRGSSSSDFVTQEEDLEDLQEMRLDGAVAENVRCDKHRIPLNPSYI